METSPLSGANKYLKKKKASYHRENPEPACYVQKFFGLFSLRKSKKEAKEKVTISLAHIFFLS